MVSTGMTEADADSTLIGHLEALRRTLWRCLLVLALALLPAYPAGGAAMEWLRQGCLPESAVNLYYFAPFELFMVRLKLAGVLAVLLAYPFWLREIWCFVRPALTAPERRVALGWIAAATLLLLAGVAFALFLLLPLMLRFALSFSAPGTELLLGARSLFDLALQAVLSCALVFQTPVLVVLGVRTGLVTAAQLRRCRPYYIVLIFILAGVFTPPDVLSQVLLALPAWALFELALLLVGRTRPAAGNQG